MNTLNLYTKYQRKKCSKYTKETLAYTNASLNRYRYYYKEKIKELTNCANVFLLSGVTLSRNSRA